MKSGLTLLVVISLAVVVSTASYIVYSGATPSTTNFTLQASGPAHNSNGRRLGSIVNVTLSVTGTETVQMKRKVVNLNIRGGSVAVTGYGNFSISWGFGQVVAWGHFFFLFLQVTGKYGGPTVFWFLSGWTGGLQGNTLNISLSSYIVTLPMTNFSARASLTGTLTPFPSF